MQSMSSLQSEMTSPYGWRNHRPGAVGGEAGKSPDSVWQLVTVFCLVWFPALWHSTSSSTGRPTRIYSCVVVHMSFNNRKANFFFFLVNTLVFIVSLKPIPEGRRWDLYAVQLHMCRVKKRCTIHFWTRNSRQKKQTDVKVKVYHYCHLYLPSGRRIMSFTPLFWPEFVNQYKAGSVNHW